MGDELFYKYRREEEKGRIYTDADLTSVGQIESLPRELMRTRGKHGCLNMHLSLEPGDKGAILKLLHPSC